MKKILFTLAFVVIALMGNAQLFIGGSLGAKYDGGHVDYSIVSPIVTENGTQFLARQRSFQFAPMIGYKMSDKISLGLRLGYTNVTTKSCSDVLVDNYDTKNIVSHFGFAPFFRYTVFSFNNLKIFADAEIPVSFATQKSIIEGNNTTLEVDEPKQFNIGLLIVPGLMYEITEHLSFVSELGLLNLGWIHQRIKVTEDLEEIAPQTTMSYTQKNNQLGFGINNHVQATIGFIYTF